VCCYRLACVATDIKAGQGIYFSASSNAFYARNCDVNSYGKLGLGSSGPDRGNTQCAGGYRLSAAQDCRDPALGVSANPSPNRCPGVVLCCCAGAAGELPGLTASPCRPCPEGTVTSLSYPTSAAYYESDTSVSPAAGGFTNPLACVTKPGYGYNGRVATRCSAGSWNPAGALDRWVARPGKALLRVTVG
jgi:hypothetical protein